MVVQRDVTETVSGSAESRVPSRGEERYAALGEYLANSSPDEDLVLSFADVEHLIGHELPPTARSEERWWGSLPRQSQSRVWLRADRCAHVDLGAQTVTFVWKVFERDNSIDRVRSMREKWVAYARGCLSGDGTLPPTHPHVLNGYWEPHMVYVLHLNREAMYKVGISRVGARRVADLSHSGVVLVDQIEVANQWAAKVVEFALLELAWGAWVRPDRFSPGREGETERWSDWLVPPRLEDLVLALEDDVERPRWGLTLSRP